MTPKDSTPLLRRIGIIGDVHGEDGALEAALNLLGGITGLDAILCTGDVPGKNGTGDLARCCDLLENAGVMTIRGNHDRWYIENEELRDVMGYEDAPLSA